jgi:hypothetical protein
MIKSYGINMQQIFYGCCAVIFFFWGKFLLADFLRRSPPFTATTKAKGINVGTLEETNKKSEKVLSLIPFMKGEWQGWSIW